MKVINDPAYFDKRVKLLFAGDNLAKFDRQFPEGTQVEIHLTFGHGGELIDSVAYYTYEQRTSNWWVKLEALNKIEGFWELVDEHIREGGKKAWPARIAKTSLDLAYAAIRGHRDGLLDEAALYAVLPESQP